MGYRALGLDRNAAVRAALSQDAHAGVGAAEACHPGGVSAADALHAVGVARAALAVDPDTVASRRAGVGAAAADSPDPGRAGAAHPEDTRAGGGPEARDTGVPPLARPKTPSALSAPPWP